MNILVIGELVNFQECQSKFGEMHTCIWERDAQNVTNMLASVDVVFDFTCESDSIRIEPYIKRKRTVFLNSIYTDLRSILSGREPACDIFGFCGMPTLLNSPLFEVSLFKKEDKDKLTRICKSLNTDYMVVEDAPGMITPRVICMIINEAYFALEGGVATRDDIDEAMRLGTNYPFGPFEWGKKIGLQNISRLLEAVHKDTQDERYRICSLLQSESLRANDK
jgi:3-hydroxybutyryl-CoA dehydrogenase